MKRLTILNICLLFTMVSSFAQTVLETYDVTDDKQTTIILRDSVESDRDILDQLDLDDYAVGEQVFITDEMWAAMQKKQEKTPDVQLINPVIGAEVPQEIMVQEEIMVRGKSVVQIVAKPAKVTKTTKAKSSSSKKTAKKKKAKKKKRVKIKKSKRRKGGNGSRGGRMACYSF